MSEYADDLRKIETDAEYVQVMGPNNSIYMCSRLDVSRAKEGLMLPAIWAGSDDFGPSASQTYRRLYRRQDDERQQQLAVRRIKWHSGADEGVAAGD
jgi:hypothetical protein